MTMILSLSIMIMIISNLLMMLSTLISKKSIMDREKCSPFECGFDPKSKARIPFSLHFFLITVIFLIFDVEIVLLFPMILSFKMSNMMSWLMTSIMFLLILLVGIYHEWNQNMLNWTK